MERIFSAITFQKSLFDTVRTCVPDPPGPVLPPPLEAVALPAEISPETLTVEVVSRVMFT